MATVVLLKIKMVCVCVFFHVNLFLNTYNKQGS
jgi:hypothetical protein